MEENIALNKKWVNSIILILKGKAEKDLHKKYFIAILVYFGISLILAQMLFPGGYSITEYHISTQGNTVLNPVGSWFFIFGASITAILFIPHFFYMHRRIMPTLGLITILMTFFALIGCIGLFLVGVVPESLDGYNWLHDIGADMAFMGLGLSALLSLFVMLRKLSLKEAKPGVLGFLIIYGITITLGVFVAITDDSIQQWLGLFTVLSWVILSFIFL
jgi:hypothetical protein